MKQMDIDVCSFENWNVMVAWQYSVMKKAEIWMMIRNELYLAKWKHLECLWSRQSRIRYVDSDHGTFITELSHQGKQKTKQTKKNTSNFSFSLYPHVPKFQHFSLKRGHVCKPHLSPPLMMIFRLNPFGARSWHFPKQPMKSKGLGVLLAAAKIQLHGVIMEMYLS